jgi:hypothetical protein
MVGQSSSKAACDSIEVDETLSFPRSLASLEPIPAPRCCCLEGVDGSTYPRRPAAGAHDSFAHSALDSILGPRPTWEGFSNPIDIATDGPRPHLQRIRYGDEEVKWLFDGNMQVPCAGHLGKLGDGNRDSSEATDYSYHPCRLSPDAE